MPIRPFVSFALAAVVLLQPLGPSQAAPEDARVGSKRAVFQKQGTVLREKPSALGAAVATLPGGSTVIVEELKLPWLRVRSASTAGQRGWLRAAETVEPSALAKNPRPAFTAGTGSAGVSARDVSAAGRQLDAGTERGFRNARPNLRRAYALVDRMEAETAAMDPYESIAFLVEGQLGRPGRSFDRPGLLPHTRSAPRAAPRASPGGLLGRVGGGLAERLGGKGGSIARSALEGIGEMTKQLNERFTPEQEYYLGRAVAAEAIAKYGVDPDAARRQYVRLVGDAIVRVSLLPKNWGGYHFEVLDSDTVNGISGPGGFVLVTRGAVEACRSEDELAAILCHELVHIRQKDGEKTLRKGKQFQSFIGTLSKTGAAAAGSKDRVAAGLVRFFGQAVGEMSRTAIEHGYGRDLEFQADTQGSKLLYGVVYDHTALRDYLQRMETHGGSTHASSAVRAGQLIVILNRLGPYTPREGATQARQARFESTLGPR